MKDLSGTRYGRLTVQCLIPRPPEQTHHISRWRCICDCGATTEVWATALRGGLTASCGCLRRERARENIKKALGVPRINGNRTHGATGTPEWTAWQEMWRRCEDPKRPYWKDYGGRGISVCTRWESFQLFLVDMGARPSPLHTLDRRDNNGNYTPENCRWSTRKEQARNRRSSALYTARGVTRTIAEWSEVLGKKASTLQARLSKTGSDPEKILVP